MEPENAIPELVHDCLAARVRLIARSVSALYDHALAKSGLTIAQVNLMAALGHIGPCAPGTLAQTLQLERSTVSRNLRLLLDEGWVDAPSSDAKGIREIALTRTGARKIASVMPAWREAQAGAARLLGDGGVHAIHSVAAGIAEFSRGRTQ